MIDLAHPILQLACRRIGQELDILDALLEFVEHRDAAFEHRLRVDRRLDAARAAIEQADAEHVLEIRDRGRDRRLGHGELTCRLGHPARFHHGREDVEVAHPKTPPEAAFPFHRDGGHRGPYMVRVKLRVRLYTFFGTISIGIDLVRAGQSGTASDGAAP